MSEKYILASDGRTPIAEPDVRAWGTWYQTANRTVAKSEPIEGVRVSTVFLGLDHAWDGGAPLLWETMIFGGPNDQYQDRYASYEEAVAGHEKAVQLCLK